VVRRPLRPCNVPGCPEIAVKGGRCAAHAAERERATDRSRPPAYKRGYDYDHRKRRARVLRECPYCVQCGAPATVVDHIVPLARGGTDDMGNLQPLCARCHNRKTNREDGGGWRQG